MTAAISPEARRALSDDTRTALRNALKLFFSLLATWGIGLALRLWLPRHLGPERLGVLSFADSLAGTVLACASLGIDTYVQKEIPVRPAHASDFYGGTLALRLLISIVLIAGLLVFTTGDRGLDVSYLLLAFGVYHVAAGLNGTLTALLQANTTVDEVALANVVTKLVWGLGMVGGILLDVPLLGLAAIYCLSEVMKLAMLQGAAGRRAGLTIRMDVAKTGAAVAASLGFYAYSLAGALAYRLDVALIGLLSSHVEVGWYAAAGGLATITLFLAPVLYSVLMPLFTRAHSRSPEEMFGAMRRVLEALTAVTAPAGLFLALGADLWVRLAFGADYGPSAISLRALAPLFVVWYLDILLCMPLVIQGRGWLLTAISLGAIVANALTAIVLVPYVAVRVGPGGAGLGMAMALVLKELLVTLGFLAIVGAKLIDRRRRLTLGATAVAALGTTAAHLALAPLGHWRLLVDLVVYVALVIVIGAVRPRELLLLGRELIASRRVA